MPGIYDIVEPKIWLAGVDLNEWHDKIRPLTREFFFRAFFFSGVLFFGVVARGVLGGAR